MDFSGGFNWLFTRTTNGYGRLVHTGLRFSMLALVVYVGLLGLTYWECTTVPTGFIPPQDKGYLIVNVQLPDGASLERTDAVIQQATKIVLQVPGVGNAVGFAGFSAATCANSANAGAIFTTLKPFEERIPHGLSARRITQDLRQRLADIQEASLAVFPPPPVRGLGTAGGFKLQVQDRAGSDLVEHRRAPSVLYMPVQAKNVSYSAALREAEIRGMGTLPMKTVSRQAHRRKCHSVHSFVFHTCST